MQSTCWCSDSSIPRSSLITRLLHAVRLWLVIFSPCESVCLNMPNHEDTYLGIQLVACTLQIDCATILLCAPSSINPTNHQLNFESGTALPVSWPQLNVCVTNTTTRSVPNQGLYKVLRFVPLFQFFPDRGRSEMIRIRIWFNLGVRLQNVLVSLRKRSYLRLK